MIIKEENELNLDFDSVDAYGKVYKSDAKKDKNICCICGEPFVGYGNNPDPYKKEGRACDECNKRFVVPSRLEKWKEKRKE